MQFSANSNLSALSKVYCSVLGAAVCTSTERSHQNKKPRGETGAKKGELNQSSGIEI
jgi:hypothetical protein